MDNLKDIVYWEDIGGDEIRWGISPKNIASFFNKSDCILRIPPYQRPYSWGEDQMNALFKDLEKNLEFESIPWFLGPIFTTKKEGFNKYVEVLDGQQRITSITIIFREAYTLYNSFEPPLDIPDEIRFAEEGGLESLKRRLNRCLVTEIDGKESALFETDESVRLDFQDYIKNAVRIRNESDYVKYGFRNKSGGSDYEQTYKNLVQNIKQTREYLLNLSKIDAKEPKFSKDGYFNLYKFIDYLLSKCWVIEIPLKDEDYILEIFESINNRGKRLTLTDLLRFKTIHLSSHNLRDDIKKRWSKLYKSLDRLESEKYISDTDHFFEVLLNSMEASASGKAFTNDQQRISFVESLLDENEGEHDKNVEKLIATIERVINFFDDYILSNGFIETYKKATPKPSLQDTMKASQLMKLARMCFKTSKNSLMLAFYIASKYDVKRYEDNNYFLQPVLDLVKYTVLKDINLDESSNIMRNLFVDLIHRIESRQLNIMNFYFMQEDRISEEGVQLNLLLNSNSKYNKLVLMLVQFIDNYQELRSIDSDALLKNNNLEHFYPVKWSKNWPKLEEEEIRNCISQLSNEDLKTTLGATIKQLFPLDDGKEKRSFIQFLGNKLIIHGTDNRQMSNRSFAEKVKLLNSPNVYIIPNLDESRFLNDESFGAESIMERNKMIIDILLYKSDIPYAEL